MATRPATPKQRRLTVNSPKGKKVLNQKCKKGIDGKAAKATPTVRVVERNKFSASAQGSLAIAAFNENTSNSTRKQSNSGQQNEFDNGIPVTVHAAENNELTDEGESQNSPNSQVTDKV